ncbi:XRE family transcriptional regulator [Eubacteriales bacterium OttesenSCG-928-N13]|nr:XRE family transcriptional regulator [Eubacteriales bacterium OttesenSCG-928-N13]
MSRLGDTIKQARIAQGLSEKALAKKCGLAESFIKQVEQGTRIISDEQAQRVLKKLGVNNPISTELEVAAEPPVKLRPKPRPYVMPMPEQTAAVAASTITDAEAEASDAWLDALSGVVKRVPVMGEDGLVIDHVPVPITSGKIEGGAPDKVLFYRCPDDALRGYRIHAGDLLLTIPASAVEDDQIMLVQYKGNRIARKLTKQDGGKLLLQSYDREFAAERVDRKDVVLIGKCVKLERRL